MMLTMAKINTMIILMTNNEEMTDDNQQRQQQEQEQNFLSCGGRTIILHLC